MALLGIKLAEFLQPFVYALGQIWLVLRGLHRKFAVGLHHLVDAFEGQFARQQLIEDEAGRVEIRGDAGLGRILEALWRLISWLPGHQ